MPIVISSRPGRYNASLAPAARPWLKKSQMSKATKPAIPARRIGGQNSGEKIRASTPTTRSEMTPFRSRSAEERVGRFDLLAHRPSGASTMPSGISFSSIRYSTSSAPSCRPTCSLTSSPIVAASREPSSRWAIM